MAVKQDIPAGVLFIGEDKKLRLRNITGDDGLPLNVAGFEFVFAFKDDPSSPNALFEKSSDANEIRVVGVFSAIAASNTQEIEVDLVGEDTLDLYKGKFHYSVRRSDIGARTVITYGTAMLDQAA